MLEMKNGDPLSVNVNSACIDMWHTTEKLTLLNSFLLLGDNPELMMPRGCPQSSCRAHFTWRDLEGQHLGVGRAAHLHSVWPY